MNSKKLSIGNFDKVSVFESTNLILVKFKINFAKKRQFLNQYFYIASDFKDNLFFFYKSDFAINFALEKLTFVAFYNEKNAKIGSFVFSFTEWISEEEMEWQTAFEPNFPLRVSRPTNIFTTHQFLNENFFQRIRCWIQMSSKHQVSN